jgi:hypothetical protein
MGEFYGDDFPYTFQCPVCRKDQDVTWEEALYYAHYQRIPKEAAKEVLRVIHGWWLLPIGTVCRECIDEAEHLKDSI